MKYLEKAWNKILFRHHKYNHQLLAPYVLFAAGVLVAIALVRRWTGVALLALLGVTFYWVTIKDALNYPDNFVFIIGYIALFNILPWLHVVLRRPAHAVPEVFCIGISALVVYHSVVPIIREALAGARFMAPKYEGMLARAYELPTSSHMLRIVAMTIAGWCIMQWLSLVITRAQQPLLGLSLIVLSIVFIGLAVMGG